MTVTISRYNQTAKKFLNNEIALNDINFMLLDNTATFTAAHTALASVAGTLAGGHYPKELYGNGWAEGGPQLASVAITIVDTNKAMLDADDISITASGGPLPPTKAYKGLIYEKTSGDVLFFVDFGDDEQAGDGTAFKVIFNANGIMRVG